MRSMQTQMLVTLQEVVISFLPTAVPIYVLGLFNAAFMADKCEFRPDQCACLSETPLVGVALDVLVIVHWCLSTAELGLYYLKIPFTRPRRLVRWLFYVSLGVFLWLDATILALLSAWTFLGLNINPLKAGPYVISAIGICLYIAFTLSKKMVFQTRVEKALVKGVALRRAALKVVASAPHPRATAPVYLALRSLAHSSLLDCRQTCYRRTGHGDQGLQRWRYAEKQLAER
jgi:hypothetical protein